jgi:hypothetical protein
VGKGRAKGRAVHAGRNTGPAPGRRRMVNLRAFGAVDADGTGLEFIFHTDGQDWLGAAPDQGTGAKFLRGVLSCCCLSSSLYCIEYEIKNQNDDG